MSNSELPQPLFPPDGVKPETRHWLVRKGTGFTQTQIWTGTHWEFPGSPERSTPFQKARDGWRYERPEP